MKEPVPAWHFLAEDKKLRYPPFTAVEAGQTMEATERRLELCHYGLHASKRAIDALQYAPGPIVCRVELSGNVIEGNDKLCAERRTVLWMANATMVLHEFACQVAEEALERERKAGREPDPRSWKAIKVKREWMAGRASDSDLDAARAAAWDAARAAAWDAARAAAWDAARDAAWAAAWDAARAAAWDAAWDAAWAAAWDAAWDAQNVRLEAMLMGLAA